MSPFVEMNAVVITGVPGSRAPNNGQLEMGNTSDEAGKEGGGLEKKNMNDHSLTTECCAHSGDI